MNFFEKNVKKIEKIKFHVEFKNGVRLIQTAVFRKLKRIYGLPDDLRIPGAYSTWSTTSRGQISRRVQKWC